jgi:hypothetical protein
MSASRFTRVRVAMAANWETFKSWHRPLPDSPEAIEQARVQKIVSICVFRWCWWSQCKRTQQRRAMLGRLLRLSPRGHIEAIKGGFQLYKQSFSPPQTFLQSERVNACVIITVIISQRATNNTQ